MNEHLAESAGYERMLAAGPVGRTRIYSRIELMQLAQLHATLHVADKIEELTVAILAEREQ